MSATKIDLKKALPCYRAQSGVFTVVEVPPMHYLMIDGRGDPNTSPAYTRAVGALFPVAYALKFASKRELGRDYVVMPLEALWWATDMRFFTSDRDTSRWNWTVMIAVPEWTDPTMVDAAVSAVASKKNVDGLDAIRFDILTEGTCVQTLHVGSYDAETAVLAELHDVVVPQAEMTLTGKHHEIYLSDPRRVPESRLRTILRQPVLRGSGIEGTPAP